MDIILEKKPKNPIVIEGFPGFGLVGTIATEFLIDHLECEQIGRIMLEEMPPMAAIHDGKVVEPLGIFYNKKHNIVMLHAITASSGFEWKLADALIQIAKQLDAREILSIEGVGSTGLKLSPDAFYYTNQNNKLDFLSHIGLKPLKEGIIMGVTGALLLKDKAFPKCAFFADTASNLPDSKAAARIIEALDKYLGLEIDYQPLLKQAEKFEEKLSGILEQSNKMQELSEKKKMSYVG
ncbi:proteasome assembly chaperone family protein [Candidatus Woesearchaeota archaeon]|nr:proteasome assembly chaperone family protein [Candidatus Woesearchaeota archaeon]